MAKSIVKKVAICIPNESYILCEAYDNHLVHAARFGSWIEKIRNEKRPITYDMHWYTTGRLLTQAAREKFLRVAHVENMDYVIMYDSDMVLPPDFAQNMLLTMEEHPEINVLGALAFMRTPPHYPVLYNVEEGYDGVRHQDYYFNQQVKKYPKDTLVECDAVGFGGVIIDMKFVREKLKDPYFMSTTPTGEDIWFCVKAKEAGGRVFMNTSIKLGHIKNPDIIDEEGYEKWVKDSGHDIGEEIPSKYNSYDK
jgi:cellulose synthase/poly-beta-1,6-N-acetylglucosamine synthase-like glycosyltransferase